MNKKEYLKVKDLSYQEYCNYLKEKYGSVPYKYGNKKNHKKGLFIHHIGEYKIPSLSNAQVRKETDPKYQEPEMLCYSDYLEHLLLHIMIGRETNPADSLGLNGPCQYIIPALINYYQDGYQNPRWDNEYYTLLDGNKDVFDLLLAEYNDLVKDIDVVLEHNTNLYAQVEHMLDTKNKALVVLGTGCGKTTTALQYIQTHKCRALLIGPNNLIKEGWSNNGDWVDTITYQAFANKYNTINYSQYGLVIIDEAHHAGYDAELGKGAKTWGKAIQYLVDNNIKLLGLTATPDRNDGVMLGETLFSDCVCQGLSVEEAIEQGVVYPFSYITSIYDKQGITEELQQLGCHKGTEDPERIKLQGQLDLALNNIPDATNILKKHMPRNKRKGIIFIQEIADAPLAVDFFKQAFPEAKFKELHSKLSKQEIKEAREWFENTDEGYLVAINMISEGAHYPGVNTVIMFRRTSSYLLYMQQIGRIITITKKENPDAIVFDLVNNINTIKPGDRTKSFNRPNINSELKRALFKIRNSKSLQIIVEDYCQDFVERLKKLKEYSDNTWENWEIEILNKYYKIEGISGCQRRINEKWEGKYNRSLSAIQHKADRLGLTASKNYNGIRPIICIETQEIFDFIADTYKKYGQGVYNCLKKDYTATAYNLHWSFLDDIDRQNKLREFVGKDINSNNIVCYELKKEYKNLKEASKDTGLNSSAIRNCIRRGFDKTCGGYHWFLKKDENKFYIPEKQIINAIEVMCYETGEIFKSMTIAEEQTGCGNISNCCKNWKLTSTNKHGQKVHWLYLKDKNNFKIVEKKKSWNIHVILNIETGEKFNGNLEVIAKYPTISKTTLHRAVHDQTKTAGGYHWQYIE